MTLTIAGNRFQFPRRLSDQAVGYNMRTLRWHLSPPVDMTDLRVVFYNGWMDAALGNIGTGNALTVAAAIEYPAGIAPGTRRAFTLDGAAQFSVPDGDWVASDVLDCYLPAKSQYRMRSWTSAANGYIPYGIPCLGESNGSLSGFGAVNDMSGIVNAGADITQTAADLASPNAVNDTAFEPFLVGRPLKSMKSYALIGDSLTYGGQEVTQATATGAGDAYGNVGLVARAVAAAGHQYVNFGVSGMSLATWVAQRKTDFQFWLASQTCNAAVILLGANDLAGGAPAILANLQNMVNKAKSFAPIVCLLTLTPKTTGANFNSAAAQTEHSNTPVINAVNEALLAGRVTGANVIDLHSMLVDPVAPTKWRSDGGAWTADGTHPSVYAMPLIAAQLAPYLR